MSDLEKKPEESKVLKAKPGDPMVREVHASLLRDIPESSYSGIEVMPPDYRPNFYGQKLDHTTYVQSDPRLDYKFCVQDNKFGQMGNNEARGWRKVKRKADGSCVGGEIKDASSDQVVVGGMVLCARDKAYGEVEREDKKRSTLIQARKYQPEAMKYSIAEEAGVSPNMITASERSQTVEGMGPQKTYEKL